MRTIIALIWLVLFVIAAIPAMIYMVIVHKKDPWKAEKTARAWISCFFRVLVKIAGTDITVKGLENVPSDRAVVYIGNHRSYFDIILTYTLCKNTTCYIAKADLRNIPLFGLWGDMMMCLFFDQSDMKASVKMILEGITRLKQGISVFIFPEGKRNREPDLLPLNEFRDGSFKLASKTGCPVIPVALKKIDDIWEAHSPWLRKTSVTICYGPPVYFNDLEDEQKKHPGEHFRQVITSMLEQM